VPAADRLAALRNSIVAVGRGNHMPVPLSRPDTRDRLPVAR